MNQYHISQAELEKARAFFSGDDIAVLRDQSIEINTSQPNFTATVLALEMYGVDRPIVEDLLESIFIVYYAQTELRQRTIKEITVEQIKENIEWFDDFIVYFEGEQKAGIEDLSQIEFIRDRVVLEFALKTLTSLFGNVASIPREVMYYYFALLKGIEKGAEGA
jgi:hypothetical protein